MKNFIFLLLFILCSCYNNEHVGDNRPTIQNNYVYIYDDKLSELIVDSCQINGTFNDYYFINRQCKLVNGNIEIGTKNSFKESGYNVNIKVYISDTLYTSIIGYKKILLIDEIKF